MTAEEIGIALGRTKQSVHRQRKRLGLHMEPHEAKRARSLGRPDQTGEKNPSWKGGVSKSNYRYTKRFREKNKHKMNAHCRVNYAIKAGKLKKLPCQVCGDQKSESHHEDYSKPLDVIWLCRTHHIEADRARRAREQSTVPTN